MNAAAISGAFFHFRRQRLMGSFSVDMIVIATKKGEPSENPKISESLFLNQKYFFVR
jgi:hypothetical protein